MPTHSATHSRVSHPSGSRRRSVAFSVHSLTDQYQERAAEEEQGQGQEQEQIYRQASHGYPLQGSPNSGGSGYGRRGLHLRSFSSSKSKSRSPPSSTSLKKKTIKFDEGRVSTATKIGLWMMGTCVDKMDKAQKAERIKRKVEREQEKKNAGDDDDKCER